MASLWSQVELQDHSRNRRSQPPGSAVPSFSGWWLCPDGRGKATNCPRLTSCPLHCCGLTSHGPTHSSRTSPPLLLIPAVRLCPGPQLVTAPVLSHSQWPGRMEHTDWPGPGHVSILSRTRVSCSPSVRGGDTAMPQEQG